jgi:hypothetical protein
MNWKPVILVVVVILGSAAAFRGQEDVRRGFEHSESESVTTERGGEISCRGPPP